MTEPTPTPMTYDEGRQFVYALQDAMTLEIWARNEAWNDEPKGWGVWLDNTYDYIFTARDGTKDTIGATRIVDSERIGKYLRAVECELEDGLHDEEGVRPELAARLWVRTHGEGALSAAREAARAELARQCANPSQGDSGV